MLSNGRELLSTNVFVTQQIGNIVIVHGCCVHVQKLLSVRQTAQMFLISMNKYEVIVSIDLLQRYTSKRVIDQDEIDVEHCIHSILF